ncbi:MAG: TIGR02996 domain-containing protein [Myxococcales bacterium]
MRSSWSRFWSKPQDDGLRQVYADWLVERGDPRGEFIALQYARLSGSLTREQEKREAELLALHRERWLGSLAAKVQVSAARFERGFAAEVNGAETDGAREWSTVRAIHYAVPGDETPVMALERLLDIKDLNRFARRTRPLPIAELHWAGGYGARMKEQLGQIDRMPPLPNLRRLDLTGSFGGAPADFFDWVWRTQLGAGLEELAVSTVPEKLEDWLALMDARSLSRLELAMPSVGRLAVTASDGARELAFVRPGASRGLSPHLSEALAKDAAAILSRVSPGSIARVEIDLGRPKFSPKSEELLRQALVGRGIAKATVLLENGARRELV